VAKTVSWRKLIKKPMSLKENLHVLQSFTGMSDQGVSLVVGSMVERALEYAISCRLTKMKRKYYSAIFDSGPLSSFENKIRMGFGLALYGPDFHDELQRIKDDSKCLRACNSSG
jgi:hypothetical protein